MLLNSMTPMEIKVTNKLNLRLRYENEVWKTSEEGQVET